MMKITPTPPSPVEAEEERDGPFSYKAKASPRFIEMIPFL